MKHFRSNKIICGFRLCQFWCVKKSHVTFDAIFIDRVASLNLLRIKGLHMDNMIG